MTSKTCGSCGGNVSLSASAGQHCPHCGVYWGVETSKRSKPQNKKTPEFTTDDFLKFIVLALIALGIQWLLDL